MQRGNPVTTPAPIASSTRWSTARDLWNRLQRVGVRGFHGYATWLTRLSWWRFFLLSILLLIIASILGELPPFSWTIGKPAGKKTGPTLARQSHPRPSPPPSPVKPNPPDGGPGEGDSEDLEKTLAEVKSALEEVQAGLDSKNIPKGLIDVQFDRDDQDGTEDEDTHEPATLGNHLPNLALLLIFCSIPLKIAYQGRQRAEATAARAVQEAENEALRRQVTEARLAAMQAQVEPHFLFNTLGSIEHLIETDPSRAARMQRSLITFLREAMPTLRETQAPQVRDLGCELAIIVPYLELLKMRMEERLRTEIRVPQGLMSAEFPPMMLQSLVENAIRHGLEPRPEGGLVTVDAAVVDGRLTVSVSDTGVGFGNSHNSGSGVGLTNIRERLRLLYGDQARLRTASPASGGTLVTIEIPYRSRSSDRTSGAPHINPSPIHESRTA